MWWAAEKAELKSAILEEESNEVGEVTSLELGEKKSYTASCMLISSNENNCSLQLETVANYN